MPVKSTWVTPLIKQSWIASSVLWSMLSVGMGMGFTSCLLVALEDPESDIQMSMEASSWLVASLGIFSLVGNLITSFLMKFYGRRTAYALDLLPGIAGMLLTGYAPNASCLIAGRALYGITAGSTAILGAVVIGEYTSPEYRPMFLNLKTALLYLGSTVVHLLGHYLHWRKVALIIPIPLLIALAIVYTWPESPSWLAEKKMFKESEESFFCFRERTEDSVKEIKELIHGQRDRTVTLAFSDKVVDFLKKFSKRNFFRPIIIYVFAAILLESSGRHIFPAYAAQIIKEIAGDAPNSFYFNLVADITITLSAIFSSYLIKKMKLRTLLFITGSIAFLILMTACLCLFLLSKDVVSKDYYWIPMVLFTLYFIFVNLGCAPIPLALIGEIFPLEHRGIGSAIAGYLIAGFMLISLKIMPYMMVNLKIYGAFGVLGISMAVALLVLYFIMPETKNRTLQEIDDYFNFGKFRYDGNIVEQEERGMKCELKGTKSESEF